MNNFYPVFQVTNTHSLNKHRSLDSRHPILTFTAVCIVYLLLCGWIVSPVYYLQGILFLIIYFSYYLPSVDVTEKVNPVSIPIFSPVIFQQNSLSIDLDWSSHNALHKIPIPRSRHKLLSVHHKNDVSIYTNHPKSL
jgi:hypothetical protein